MCWLKKSTGSHLLFKTMNGTTAIILLITWITVYTVILLFSEINVE